MRYLFLIARTPKEFRTPLRDQLWELTKRSLCEQTNADWEALVMDEEDWDEGKIKGISSPAKLKYHKIVSGMEVIKKRDKHPIYVIRFDDDDLISSTVLDAVSVLDADCIAESRHNYIDLVYLRAASTKRAWLANTVMHKFVHAAAIIPGQEAPLIALDHSKFWHGYYAGKKVHFLPAVTPVYHRIISPVSITSRSATHRPEGEWGKYTDYLSTFGKWNELTPAFSFFSELKKISASHFADVPPLPRKSFFDLFNLKKKER
jgi:hypothetical protein